MGAKDCRRIDPQGGAFFDRRQSGIAPVEFDMRVLVKRRRPARSSDVSDSYSIILVSDLKISYVKDGERDIR